MPDLIPIRDIPVKANYSHAMLGTLPLLPQNGNMKNVRALRTSRGLTQAQLAEAVGCNQSMISKIEKGEANPTLDTLERIAAILRVPPFMLFELPELQQRVLNALESIPEARRPAVLSVLEGMAHQD